MNTKSFKEVRAAAIYALRYGIVLHEARTDQPVKNLLASGLVTPDFVAVLLSICPASSATRTEHHILESIDVWEFRPEIGSGAGTQSWYVKLYFHEDCVFISVHQ